MSQASAAKRIHKAVAALSGIRSDDGEYAMHGVSVHNSSDAVIAVAGLDGGECRVAQHDAESRSYLVATATMCGVEITAFGPFMAPRENSK